VKGGAFAKNNGRGARTRLHAGVGPCYGFVKRLWRGTRAASSAVAGVQERAA
jgi:hypothetical protein